MKFPYIKTPYLDPHKKWIARPIIPITLFGPAGNINISALIDSGADRCLFNAEIGQEIGLDIYAGQREFFSGIEGGRLIGYLHKIQLQIMGIDKIIDIVAGFTEAKNIIPILGQDGFFDNFRIRFEKDHDIIEIIPTR